MNREEASEIQKRIISECRGLTELDVVLVIPTASDPISHGYQIHIKSDQINNNLLTIRAIARKQLLAVDETRKGLLIIRRPCFLHYSNQRVSWTS